MGKKKGKDASETPNKDEVEFDAFELVTKKPHTVVLMLQSHEENVLQSVCNTLYKFAEKAPENKAHILNFGALEYLVNLLGHENKLVRRNACMCIGSISSEVAIRRAMRKLDCISRLLPLLSPDEDIVCHEFSTLSLSFFAEDFTAKGEIFEKDGLPLLISHLQSFDCDVQRNSARAVGLMVQDYRPRIVFHEHQGIEPLLNLLNSEYPIIQTLALDALITCSKDADCRKAVQDCDGVSKLIDVMTDETMNDLHLPCLKCLEHCLCNYESVQLMQRNGLFEKLLELIGDTNQPDVQQYAAVVIAVASQTDDIRRVFNEQLTEDTLITLLSNENLKTIVCATKAVAALCANAKSKEKIGKLGGVGLICRLLKNENNEAREVACLALSNLTNGSAGNCQHLLTDIPALKTLIEYLSLENGVVQANSASCLSHLGINEAWRSEVINHGLIEGLTNALQSSDTSVQLCSCEALLLYLCDAESRRKFFELQGMSSMVQLLSSNQEAIRRHVCSVLITCTMDAEIVEEIVVCGGLEALQELNLSSRKSMYTETALESILNHNLSAKYANTGILTFTNVIDGVFYDTGKSSPGNKFETLLVKSKEPVNQNRSVLLVNTAPIVINITKDGRLENNKAKKNSKIKISKTSTTLKPCGVMQPHEREDHALHEYLLHVSTHITLLTGSRKQAEALARFVNEKMGGPIVKADAASFSYEFHVSELKSQLNSNIVSIGMVKKGTYYHRALLFKVLADHIKLPCSLVRGEYGRAWNEVQLFELKEKGEVVLPPTLYIIDLMHEPGNFMVSGSPSAVAYQTI